MKVHPPPHLFSLFLFPSLASILIPLPACSLSVSAGHVYCSSARLWLNAAPPHTGTTGWNCGWYCRSALWRNASEFKKIYDTYCLLLPRQEANSFVHFCQKSAIHPEILQLLRWLVEQTNIADNQNWAAFGWLSINSLIIACGSGLSSRADSFSQSETLNKHATDKSCLSVL